MFPCVFSITAIMISNYDKQNRIDEKSRLLFETFTKISWKSRIHVKNTRLLTIIFLSFVIAIHPLLHTVILKEFERLRSLRLQKILLSNNIRIFVRSNGSKVPKVGFKKFQLHLLNSTCRTQQYKTKISNNNTNFGDTVYVYKLTFPSGFLLPSLVNVQWNKIPFLPQVASYFHVRIELAFLKILFLFFFLHNFLSSVTM